MTNTLSPRLRAIGGFCIMLVAACSSSSKNKGLSDTAGAAAIPATAARDTAHKALAAIPASVDSLGTHAEDLYDAVKAGAWGQAQALLASLRRDVAALPSETPNDARSAVTATADSLAAEIGSHRRIEAMADANRATYISAQLVRDYASSTPVQVLLLDYEGRELELWASQRNMAKLATVKADLRRTWDEVKPAVGARDARQAAHTEALVATIEKAGTPAALAKLATPFLDEVDLLEKVFTNQ